VLLAPQCTAMHCKASQWSTSVPVVPELSVTFRNVPLLLQGGLVCDALQCRLQYMHRMHRNAPQWSASLLQRFRISLQCTIMVRSTPQWYGSVLRCFCNAPLTHRGLSVCRSTFSILAKRLSGIIQWDAVGDGGWGGVCIDVLDFGGDRRREWAVFGG